MGDSPLLLELDSGRRFKNPCQFCDLYCYEGPVKGFDFKTQKANYANLQETLKPYGLSLSYVWGGQSSKRGIIFIVATEGREVVWQKYCPPSKMGSNSVYVHKYKLRLSRWFSKTEEQRKELLNLFDGL